MFGKKIKTEIKVEGMHCMHCASKVEAAVKTLGGVKSVKADPASKSVVIVSSETLDKVALSKAISDAGFQLVE